VHLKSGIFGINVSGMNSAKNIIISLVPTCLKKYLRLAHHSYQLNRVKIIAREKHIILNYWGNALVQQWRCLFKTV
jgi:hypothetical protein